MAMWLCPEMDGMPQGAMDGDVAMPRDGQTDFCSCKIYISAIPGGHISQGVRMAM